MAPIYVKGGAWTNVEDEILKAAVSKYGLNQWSRVSSLLTKKSAKQAKARWNEWLNPLINKSEWSKEEDEKLLNLVKLLPNQWRSIAPIMGRTATHCIERYQKLLEDEMSISDDDDKQGDDLKFSGPGIESMPASGSMVGDLNLHPESKPAKPDDEDISDDDREMLFEAKSRLVNTKGKRAKRKEREKMLEETKRISLLQKRRELQTAGIKVSLTSKNKKKSKEIDYNADIPFEVTPSMGLYDVEEENAINLQDTKDFEHTVKKLGLELDQKQQEDKRQDKRDKAKRQVDQLQGNEEIYEQRKKVKLTMPELEKVENFEENELTGVFQPSSSDTMVQDIDTRISNVMRDIQNQQSKTSTLLGGDVEILSNKTPVKSVDKSIKRLLKQSFNELPSPKNNYQVLPKFDDSEELQLIKNSDMAEESEKLKQLELLRQVEVEKSKTRRSQVIQRGLDVPNPIQLKAIDTTKLNDLDRNIVQEFQRLIKSDYKKYVNSDYDGEEVDDLDEELYEKVHKEIQAVINPVQRPVTIEVNLDYPPSEINLAVTTLQGNITQLLNQYNEKCPPRETNVQDVHQSLIDESIKLHTYTHIQQMEEIAIKNRTDKLNDLVEYITHQETRLNDYIRSHM